MKPGSIHDHPDNKFVAVEMWVVDLLDGDHAAAFLLSQLMWWHQPAKGTNRSKLRFERDGKRWLLRQNEEWWAECRLSAKQVRRIKTVLRKAGLIEHRIFRIDGTNVSAWRPDPDGINAALEAASAEAGPGDADPPTPPAETPAEDESRTAQMGSSEPPPHESRTAQAGRSDPPQNGPSGPVKNGPSGPVSSSLLKPDLEIPKTLTERSCAAPSAPRLSAFDRWWRAYPAKRAKPDALRAWPTALKAAGGDAERLIAAAERYRDDPNREPKFTPYPAKWLKGERWDDEPLPPRLVGVAGRGARAPTKHDRTMAAIAQWRQEALS